MTIAVDAAGQRQNVTTDATGTYVVSSLPNGPVTLTGQLSGFTAPRRALHFDQSGQQVDMTLPVGSTTESLTVTAAIADRRHVSDVVAYNSNRTRTAATSSREAAADEVPSVNVQNLQRRASGVLPVRMEVPRAGTSHRFVKPLVIDEETRVTFRYKRR